MVAGGEEKSSRGRASSWGNPTEGPTLSRGSITMYKCSLCARGRESWGSFSQLEAVKQV